MFFRGDQASHALCPDKTCLLGMRYCKIPHDRSCENSSLVASILIQVVPLSLGDRTFRRIPYTKTFSPKTCLYLAPLFNTEREKPALLLYRRCPFMYSISDRADCPASGRVRRGEAGGYGSYGVGGQRSEGDGRVRFPPSVGRIP